MKVIDVSGFQESKVLFAIGAHYMASLLRARFDGLSGKVDNDNQVMRYRVQIGNEIGVVRVPYQLLTKLTTVESFWVDDVGDEVWIYCREQKQGWVLTVKINLEDEDA